MIAPPVRWPYPDGEVDLELARRAIVLARHGGSVAHVARRGGEAPRVGRTGAGALQGGLGGGEGLGAGARGDRGGGAQVPEANGEEAEAHGLGEVEALARDRAGGDEALLDRKSTRL